MHYQRYVAGVERRKAVLRRQLEEANTLRQEARLPLRTMVQTEPLLTQQQFDIKAREQAGFNRFKRERLDQANLPTSEPTDWQQQRALVFRRMFLEHQIQMAWHDRERQT